jgi:DNA-binding CsgD family transcriptional regulator
VTTGRPIEDPLEAELKRRLERATSAAAQILGVAIEDESDFAVVSELISAIESRLDELGPETDWREHATAHRAELESVHQRHQTRFDALANAERAVAALREITAPSAILSRAPRELCEHSQLEHAMLSLIGEGRIIAEAAYFRHDPVGAVKAVEEMRRQPPRLEHPLIETEIIRRRRATIITDAHRHPRTHRATAETMGWDTYVAAPVVVRGEVIGIMHADSGATGRPLDVLDGDVLWTFVCGLADAYETASLRRLLRRQRERMRQFADWFTARAMELSDTWMEHVAEPPLPPPPPGKLEPIAASPNLDDRVVFQDLLTRRELDVLRLLATGETNSSIAAQLVISEATVKFHVVNLLRKLHVSNRAQAASRYHRLVQTQSVES